MYYIFSPRFNINSSPYSGPFTGVYYFIYSIYTILKQTVDIEIISDLNILEKNDICFLFITNISYRNMNLNDLKCDKVILINSETYYGAYGKTQRKIFNNKKIKLWIDYTYKNKIPYDNHRKEQRNFMVIPFLCDPLPPCFKKFDEPSIQSKFTKDIDILFYGWTPENRQHRRSKIKQEFETYKDLNICWTSCLKGENLLEHILRSKVVLVVHFYEDDKPLDIYRISYIIRLKTPIIHEDIQDEDKNGLDNCKLKYINFVPYDKIISTSLEYVKNYEKYKHIAEECYNYHDKHNNLRKCLPVKEICSV